jgi:hypothetical protein
VCAATATLITGCASGGTTASGGTIASAAKPLTPRQAVDLAASQSKQITSISTSLTVKAGGAANETTTGSMQIQLKPAVLMSAALNVTADGNTIPIDEILNSKAIYLKVAALSQMVGKPWIKLSLAQLSGKLGVGFGQLVQSAQNGNPLDQTRIFTVAKNVRATGTQVIDGVQTTRYTGSYTASAALAALPPSLRTAAPELKELNGVVRFTVWIDAQHQVRQLAEVENVNGETVNSIIDVTAINQPVSVKVPPSSQVAGLPQSLLNRSGSGGGVL